MVGKGVAASRAFIAGAFSVISIFFIAAPDDVFNWVGAILVAISISWFVLEVFQGPEIIDDRIVAQELFLEMLAEDEGDGK